MADNTRSNPYTQSGKALERHAQPNAAVQRHKAFFEARLPQIQRWVTQGVKAEAIVRYALMDISTNVKLRECSEQSLYLGLLACAVTGLEPGGLKGEAYLVPFAKEAVFMPGWKGLVKQARRSREIRGIVANVVREHDLIQMDLGTRNELVHRPALHNRGEVVGAYAIATMVGEFHEIEWMDRDDLDAIQKVAESRGKSPAWKDWEDQMQRKSVIRRLCKRLPLGADYFVGLALEQAEDHRQIIDIETDGEASRAAGAAQISEEVRDTSGPTDGRVTEVAREPTGKASVPNVTSSAKGSRGTREKSGAVSSANGGVQHAAPPASPQTTQTPPQPPTSAAPDGDEVRTCILCGVEILVPLADPPGAQCEACAAS